MHFVKTFKQMSQKKSLLKWNSICGLIGGFIDKADIFFHKLHFSHLIY